MCCGICVREPALVARMHEESLEMGIKEAETDFDDSPEAGGKGRVTDPSVRLSIACSWAPPSSIT